MCWEILKGLLVSPTTVIKSAKKLGSDKTMLILLIEWFLVGIGVYVLSAPGLSVGSIKLPVAVMILGSLSTLFIAVINKIVFNTLGGRGDYFTGLKPVVLALFPASIGMTISALLLQIHMSCALLVMIIMSMAVAYSMAIFYRGVKEFFGLDMVTTWIGVGIVIGGIVLAFYLTFFMSNLASEGIRDILLTQF